MILLEQLYLIKAQKRYSQINIIAALHIQIRSSLWHALSLLINAQANNTNDQHTFPQMFWLSR